MDQTKSEENQSKQETTRRRSGKGGNKARGGGRCWNFALLCIGGLYIYNTDIERKRAGKS